jgi:hypothetical protein
MCRDYQNQLFADRRTSFSQRGLGKSVYCYTLKVSLLAQTFQWPVAIQNGDLLAPRRQDRQVRKFNFFAAFARDVPSLVAALPR